MPMNFVSAKTYVEFVCFKLQWWFFEDFLLKSVSKGSRISPIQTRSWVGFGREKVSWSFWVGVIWSYSYELLLFFFRRWFLNFMHRGAPVRQWMGPVVQLQLYN